ncbi:Na+/H+ antiporter [Listeria cornellensis FSL F6-0969]|uniref:Na+/H+ antiporter n=1 Tax=Listeria cornellensis FSL F6-0969 TaxID=1265820 RepID=W7BX27_9LIST|nr:hypothetical protein [Listeria cornellensis]EUJ31324.1 Na+/H+ antiporter [Listeria cornellensis FSL F6-0969]
MNEMKQNPEQYQEMIGEIRDLREKNASVVNDKLKALLNDTNQAVIWPLINENKRILEQMKQERGSMKSREKFEQAKKDVQLQAVQIERDVIQSLFEQGRISRDLARELRQNLNLYETYYFGNEELA